MYEIHRNQLTSIYGGNDSINKQVDNACKNMPDSASVKVTSTVSGTGSALLGGRTDSYTATVTVNCGDLHHQQQAPQKGK